MLSDVAEGERGKAVSIIIPEEDKICTNCNHFGPGMDQGDEHLCHGEMPCVNYHEGNTENYFEPEDDYLESEFGCDACIDSIDNHECHMCSKNYENRWRRGEI